MIVLLYKNIYYANLIYYYYIIKINIIIDFNIIFPRKKKKIFKNFI